jgi:hypothetical protein
MNRNTTKSDKIFFLFHRVTSLKVIAERRFVILNNNVNTEPNIIRSKYKH